MLKVGVIGLGKMGGPIALKLQKTACQLIVYDRDASVAQEFTNKGIQVAASIADLSGLSDIIWVMVSAPQVDVVLKELCTCTTPGTVIIDGGNSYFIDTIRREAELKQKNLDLLDCGTSGGLSGAERGFSLTVGGDYEIFKKVEQVFAILAASHHAYSYVGPTGAGHYVKMVHNGIEYAMLQAYAEGFHLLHNGHYKHLDLATISGNWLSGAVIRSWLLKLMHDILLYNQDLENINGAVGENGTGRWTVQEAHNQGIPVKLIEDALQIRQESRVTGGNYATKLVAMTRHEMGGHPLAQSTCPVCERVR